MMGGDLPTLDDFSLKLLTDKQMLACNQNGVMGHLEAEKAGFEIWRTPEKGEAGKGWIGVFNRNGVPKSIQINKSTLGLEAGKKYNIRNIWTRRNVLEKDSKQVAKIGANGVLFLRYEA
jgi:hypothetical protein